MLLVKTRLVLKCLSMSFVTMANLDGSHLLGCENSVKQLDFCSNIQCVFFCESQCLSDFYWKL